MRERLLIALAPLALLGCQTHLCDASAVTVDDSDGGGAVPYVPGSNVWVSAPSEGPWLDYAGEETVTFKFPKEFRPSSYTVQPWLSTDPNQGPGQGTATLAGGQLGELSNQTPEGFNITNGNCAEYFLRVVVTADPGKLGAPDASRE